MDEPGSSLDTAAEIYGPGAKERQGTTLVAVTHDAARVRGFADRMGILKHGRMIASGTPEELADSRDELVRVLASGEEGKNVVSKS
jgi:phospholipid/cholesterol/gamma-HCH transport system ATP-binding protein